MRKVVLCGIPHHSNLGDHAIYIAEKNLIKKKFPKDRWSKLHFQLVLFGRYKCKAIKPDCKDCPFFSFCKEKKKSQ